MLEISYICADGEKVKISFSKKGVKLYVNEELEGAYLYRVVAPKNRGWMREKYTNVANKLEGRLASGAEAELELQEVHARINALEVREMEKFLGDTQLTSGIQKI